MPSAVIFLTVHPSPELVAFAAELQTDALAVYIAIDDSSYDATALPVKAIQYSSQECLDHGFFGIVLPYTVKNERRPCAWEKAMYHVCVKDTSYDFVYFIEDDVFISNTAAIDAMERRYKTADLLCASHGSYNPKWPHWPRNKLLPQPWFNSMMCACRLSKKLLAIIREFGAVHKTLMYHEYFFNTLAAMHKLEIQTPVELRNITWNNKWTESNIQLGLMYHPVKIQKAHPLLRLYLIRHPLKL